MPTTQKWRPEFIVILPAALLALFFIPLAAHAQIDLKRAQEFYEKALQEKKITARVELLQKAAQLYEASDPASLPPAARRQCAAIHFALGREYFQQAKWPAAIVHLEKALAGDPTFFAAHATLALIYFQQRKYDEAIAAYNKVLPAQPSAQLYNNLGAAHEAKGDLAAAVAAYHRALELEAGLAPAQKNLQRAQEKLARHQALEAKIAAIDSVQLAAQRRDSLAAAAQQPVQRLNKNKTPKSPNSDRAKTPEIKTPAIAEKNKKAPVGKKDKPTRQREAAPSSPPPSVALKKDSLAARQLAGLDITKKTTEVTSSPLPSPPPAVITAAKNSSGNSTLAYVCGAGVVLLGALVYTQRRRLNRVWLQFKPALATPAAVVTEERLIPAATAPRVAAIKREKLVAPIVEEQAVAVAEKSVSPAEDENRELHHPSLQTQAFFAEMIAAEPEIEEFGDELQEASANFSAELKPTNGHTNAALVEVAKVSGANESVVQADELLTSSPIVVSVAELSEKNGTPEEEQAVISNQLPVSSERLPVSSDQLSGSSEQLPVSSNQLSGSSEQLPVSSNQLSGSSEQLPVIGSKQPATSNQQPATNNLPSALGRYQIEREIGQGAMGKIYLARDPKLDRQVVIKTVSFKLAASDADITTLKDRVYREARAIAKLSHPNIVVVYDVEDDHDLSYIVMEYIDGRDLRQALKAERRFDHERAVKIIAQVCSALDYAHQEGIIHRDIKPSNIMLLPNDKAKVTDFGIAKIADNFSLTLPGHVLGTPSYMAPEQFDGETSDSRADIFSLGVVLYELLTGSRPFAGDSLVALAYKIVHKMHIPPSLQNVELPLALDEIVGRALAKRPEERYQTAQEFREALLGVEIEMV